MARRSIVIVGGGIAGLSAAWELSGGATARSTDDLRIELVESAPILGGALRTRDFAGRDVDCGPDGFLARRPEATELVEEIGLSGQLEPIAASGAWLYLSGRLERLPEGLVLGVPTSSKSLRQLSGLSRRARVAAWRDEHAPRRLEVTDDATIGEIVRAKLGDEIAEQVVEPLIGGIQAGRIDGLSAAAVFPALLEAAREGGSLMRAIAPTVATADAGPAFYTLRDGVGSLPRTLVDRLVERGVVIVSSSEVVSLRRSPMSFYGWEVDTETTTTPANAVVVATPPRATAKLLGAFHPSLAAVGEIDSASNVMVTFEVKTTDVDLPETGTGVLVPLNTPFESSTMMTTAITLLDRKWPHLDDGTTHLVRAHVGRIDDDRSADMADGELAARVASELSAILGRWPMSAESFVQRWPAGLPQYRLGHLEAVAAARHAALSLGVALAGNAYDGVGIPASIGSGRRAAREALAMLGAQR
jgi:oxygen-dependent protoporphyrinogen oxidase